MECKGFWYACDMLVGPSAVVAEWRQLAGDEYEAAKVFLRPMQELARSYPCTRSYPCGCCHRVVIHNDDDIVAVCTCEDQDCDRIRLTKSDIVPYELDRQALYRAMAKSMPLEVKGADVPNLHWTAQVGSYIPSKGFRLPVFLTTQIDSRCFRNVVHNLLISDREPFMLMAPTSNLCEPDCMELLKDRCAVFVALSDVFVVDASGVFAVDESFIDALEVLCRQAAGIWEPDEARPVWKIPKSIFDQEEGFRIVYFHGQKLNALSKNQTEVVRILHEAFEKGHPEMSFGSIAVRMTDPPRKMSDIFRYDDPRNVLVKRVKSDIYRLNV
ncbi:MAG: hypothetical protein ACYC64_20250 [Armatimonadota bacterium]